MVKKSLHFLYLYVIMRMIWIKAMIGSSCAKEHFCSECGMVKAVWVWRWAFPRELPPEK